ncbi:MAG TPA: hypothetical protein VFE24_10935 [Pirellulales bacterium]|jgi:hypothetical protein|nr:hypothetical protein [Pirellulales bacterium]
MIRLLTRGSRLFFVFGLGLFLAVQSGCDRASNRPYNSPPTAPITPPTKANVQVDQNGTHVDVAKPAEKPAVDVNVRPQGGVDVNVDREQVREKIEERRADKAANQPNSEPNK